MYSNVKAFVHSSDGLILLFHILSGVLQGCPLSGSLFTICIEPFIRRLYALIDAKSLGCTRVCADDIGIVLRDRMVLKRLKGVFDTAALVAGAVLKPVKCIIVPIAVVFSDEVAEQFKEWLANLIPEWSHFAIKSVGKYLGFILGPASEGKSFEAPLRKWFSRSRTIHTSGMPAPAAVMSYNSRAISVLTYVAQLEELPRGLGRKEVGVLNNLMRYPPQSLSCPAAFDLWDYGHPRYCQSMPPRLLRWPELR